MLLGPPLPTEIGHVQADRIADHVIPTDDIAALERELAAERHLAAMRAQRAVPQMIDEVELPRAVDPATEERWYRVVRPDGKTEAYACGTSVEAREYWEWAGDGYRVEVVADCGQLMQLGLLCNLSGAVIRGAPIKRLADELAEWRSERTFGN